MSEAVLSERAVYSARPTVRVGGEENEQLNTLLVGMEMTESEGGMSALELVVNAIAAPSPDASAGFAWEDAKVLDFGKTITVYAGEERGPQEIFRGVITGLEAGFPGDGTPTLTVLAEDALQRARMARRTAVHDNATIAALARELASKLSLTPVITGLGDDLQVAGGELHVSPRGDVRRGSVTLELGGQLVSARILADLSHQVTQVTATGWDPVQGQRISATSTGAHPGPGSGDTGAATLQRTLGNRSEHVRELAVVNDAEARALADAVHDRRARSFVTVEATAQGNPAIRVGTHVKLEGVGPRFGNTYYVTRAVHRFDTERGYLTHFEAGCAFVGVG